MASASACSRNAKHAVDPTTRSESCTHLLLHAMDLVAKTASSYTMNRGFVKTLEIKGVRIGEGVPKTIVSLMGTRADECLAQARDAVRAGADMVEWRADFAECPENHETMVQFGRQLADALPKTPLLFTFRSACEGGNATLADEEYIGLNRTMIASGAIDLVDIEMRIGHDAVSRVVDLARDHGVMTVVSHHDFEATPSSDAMCELLTCMAQTGADIPKLAVMANSADDVLNLLRATEHAHRETGLPLITMAMGQKGAVTRLMGEAFGSCATFCALEQASAPGQVELKLAKQIMKNLHDAIG